MSETTSSRRPLVMRLLGIRRRGDGKRFKFIKFIPTKWGWLLIVLGVGLGGMAAFAEYSMQPDFCRSCHLMEPYYQAWHQSTHKGVNCTKCHFEPGLENTLYGKWQASSQAVKYLTKTYGSKPHAEIRDSSCMREGCHEKRLLEGKVNWPVRTINGGEVTIKFDHKPHLTEERRGKQLRCVSCHSQIVQGQHLVVTTDTCFLCHFKGLEHGRHEQVVGGCTGCHDAPKEKIRLATGEFNHSEYVGRGVTCENCHSDSIKGDGAVPQQVCWNCHNQPSQVARYSEPRYLHDQHVNLHKVECSACHIQIEHNLTAGATNLIATSSMKNFESGTCGSCHESTHLGPAELYRGTGGRGVPDMPSPMSRAQVDCIACHKATKHSSESAEVIGQTFLGVQDSCNYCHGTKYEGVLDVWKRQVAFQLDKSEAALLDAKKAVEHAELSGVDQLKVNRLLDDASHNVRLVKLGHGVHNVNYATAVLSVAQENCKEVMKLIAAERKGGPVTVRSVQLRVLLILTVIVALGCEKRSDDATTTRPASAVAGASPEHYLTTMPNTSAKPPIARVPPATKPTSSLKPGTSCVSPECHATFTSAPQIHGPVSKGACDSCHSDDVGGHRFPLKHKGNENCTFCHTVVGSASHQHKAVEIGCTSCHQPHVSNAKFLLKQDTIERTCAACHDVPLKKHAHDPFAKGECTLCHLPHEADNVQLLRGGTGAKHCFTCHSTLAETFKTAAVVHGPAKTQCDLCHDPHATDFDHQLKKPVDQTCFTCHDKIKKQVESAPVAHAAMTTDKQCGNCHDPHAAAQADLLRHRTDQLCLTCHAGMKAKLANAKFLHGPNRAGNCSACHDPHGGVRSNLLKKPFPESFYARFDLKQYELCFGCHESQMVLTAKTDSLTNFRDGETNLHFAHVNRDEKGRSCRTCHDVHGSNLPRHMASDVPFEGSKWSMPVGFEQTTDGGRCAPGCHSPREYKRTQAATTKPTIRGVK